MKGWPGIVQVDGRIAHLAPWGWQIGGMDSFTHLFVGGAIAAAIAPPGHRRAALLAGAALNTLPDLDVLPLLLSDDPIVRMTWHRGATHSLLVLPWVGLLLWWIFKGREGRVAEAPTRWFWVFQCALLSHPLLDACTVYGTQLWWPLPVPPAMGSSLFIIDPMLTLPLVVGCLLAAWLGARPAARKALVACLAVAVAYVGWSFVAKAMVDRVAARSLAAMGLGDAPRFSVPMPFNTLLWRVVAMTPEGFVEGERSLVADRGPMVFTGHRSNTRALGEVREQPNVARLLWFNHHFMKAEVRDGRLVLSDLRMGAEPDYSFRFAVAEPDGEGWRAIPAEQMEWPWDASRRLPDMWARIWHSPVGTSGQNGAANAGD
jgi:inner membrane protein